MGGGERKRPVDQSTKIEVRRESARGAGRARARGAYVERNRPTLFRASSANGEARLIGKVHVGAARGRGDRDRRGLRVVNDREGIRSKVRIRRGIYGAGRGYADRNGTIGRRIDLKAVRGSRAAK